MPNPPNRSRRTNMRYHENPLGPLAHPCRICDAPIGHRCRRYAWDNDGLRYESGKLDKPHPERGKDIDWDNL